MVITCPSCQACYRIDPAGSHRRLAKVKCPECKHLFEVDLAQSESEPSGGSSASASLPRVLVVDDARFFREMIKDLLKELPVDLLDASDGMEAWELITSLRPQLVLLDLNIPGKNGKQILSDLRSSREFDTIKVVIMSSVERGDATASEMRRCGADDFINKSFKPRELQRRIRELLGL